MLFVYEKKRLLQERYRLDRMLGKGGQGQVFLAFDMKLKNTGPSKDSRRQQPGSGDHAASGAPGTSQDR